MPKTQSMLFKKTQPTAQESNFWAAVTNHAAPCAVPVTAYKELKQVPNFGKRANSFSEDSFDKLAPSDSERRQKRTKTSEQTQRSRGCRVRVKCAASVARGLQND